MTGGGEEVGLRDGKEGGVIGEGEEVGATYGLKWELQRATAKGDGFKSSWNLTQVMVEECSPSPFY